METSKSTPFSSYKPTCNVLEKDLVGREASIKSGTTTELHLELITRYETEIWTFPFSLMEGYLCNPPQLGTSSIRAPRSWNIFNAGDGIIEFWTDSWGSKVWRLNWAHAHRLSRWLSQFPEEQSWTFVRECFVLGRCFVGCLAVSNPDRMCSVSLLW